MAARRSFVHYMNDFISCRFKLIAVDESFKPLGSTLFFSFFFFKFISICCFVMIPMFPLRPPFCLAPSTSSSFNPLFQFFTLIHSQDRAQSYMTSVQPQELFKTCQHYATIYGAVQIRSTSIPTFFFYSSHY